MKKMRSRARVPIIVIMLVIFGGISTAVSVGAKDGVWAGMSAGSFNPGSASARSQMLRIASVSSSDAVATKHGNELKKELDKLDKDGSSKCSKVTVGYGKRYAYLSYDDGTGPKVSLGQKKIFVDTEVIRCYLSDGVVVDYYTGSDSHCNNVGVWFKPEKKLKEILRQDSSRPKDDYQWQEGFVLENCCCEPLNIRSRLSKNPSRVNSGPTTYRDWVQK